MDAGRRGQSLAATRLAPPPHMAFGRLLHLVGEEHHPVGRGVDDGPDLEVGGGDGSPGDEQSPGAVPVAAGHQPAVAQQRGRPRDELDPAVVVLLVEQLGRARGGVGGQHVQPPLVARLDGDEHRSDLGPAHVDEVGEALAVPADLGAGAVVADDVERDEGVVRAGHRVGELGRSRRRVGRVGDPPALDGRGVDPRHGHRLAVGRPPVAPVAVHLLGRDELRRAPADVGVVVVGGRAGQLPAPPVELGHTQRSAAHVGDTPGGRVGAGVDHGAFHRELPRHRPTPARPRTAARPAQRRPPAPRRRCRRRRCRRRPRGRARGGPARRRAGRPRRRRRAGRPGRLQAAPHPWRRRAPRGS